MCQWQLLLLLLLLWWLLLLCMVAAAAAPLLTAAAAPPVAAAGAVRGERAAVRREDKAGDASIPNRDTYRLHLPPFKPRVAPAWCMWQH